MFRNRTTRLHVECLESRNPLAGNVAAFVSGGDLIINGDGAPNTISVESAGAGNVQVRGFNNGTPTSVNGDPNGIRIFSEVGDIFIRLRGGNDVVRVTNLVVRGDLLVDLGFGHDESISGRNTAGETRFAGLPSGPLFVQGALRVIGQTGADLAFQSDAHVQGVGLVNLGGGNDTFRTQRPPGSGANVEYAGRVTVLPGDGEDTVDLIGMVVDDNMVIDDGTGRFHVNMGSVDVHGDLSIFGDAVGDTVQISSTRVDDVLSVLTFGGNDLVNVSAIARHLFVDSGSEQDQLHINSTNTDILELHMGTGFDDLDLLSARTDLLIAHGNDGNDTFLVRNTRAIDAFFFGDAGFDIYRQSALLPNNISNLNRFSIERVETV